MDISSGDTPLYEQHMAPDPFEQFARWSEPIFDPTIPESTAMTLATATADGRPSARIVLLKGIDDRGFIFYTNFDSRKGAELVSNPRAAVAFHWPDMRRQVRIEGVVERVDEATADAYFASRPRGSRLGAWISKQSAVITRAQLEADFASLCEKYADQDIPRPPFWGGFRLVVETMEFWQSRTNRLHDRLRYQRSAGGQWIIKRLAP